MYSLQCSSVQVTELASNIHEAVFPEGGSDIASRVATDFPTFDDSSYWGPFDDNFQTFIDVNWDTMDAQNGLMNWAI